MPLINIPAGSEILGAMITPAVLISASGMLSLATANRLGRVVDRIRLLTELAETLTGETPAPYAEEKRALISGQLLLLVRRLRILQTAVTLFYVSIGIYVVASITVGLSLTANWDNGTTPAVIGLCGALTMFSAVVLMVIETRLAVRSSLVEVGYTRRLVERATAVPEVSQSPPPMA